MAPTPPAPSPRTPPRAITCEAASKPPTPSPAETTCHRRGMQINPATRRTHSASAAPRTLTCRSDLLLQLAALLAAPTSSAKRRELLTSAATQPPQPRNAVLRRWPTARGGAARLVGPCRAQRSEHDRSLFDVPRRGQPKRNLQGRLRVGDTANHLGAPTQERAGPQRAAGTRLERVVRASPRAQRRGAVCFSCRFRRGLALCRRRGRPRRFRRSRARQGCAAPGRAGWQLRAL